MTGFSSVGHFVERAVVGRIARRASSDHCLAYAAQGRPAGGMKLDLFRLDREWNDGAAKTQLFTIFDALKPQDPIVLKGRRRLSSMIFA